MAIEIQAQGANGQTALMTPQHIMAAMQMQGEQPVGMSADGLSITLQDGQGQFTVPVDKALEGMGWRVVGMTPLNADVSNVQASWRGAVHALPDDMMRRVYIESQMKRAGVETPTIIGGGRDWFVFNPQTQQWIAVTNSGEWDSSDLVEGGMEGARMAGSMAGGAAGFTLGGGPTPMGVLGAAAGAGVGGGAVDAAMRTAYAAFDPTYRETVMGNPGAVMSDMAFRAGLDAATGGLGAGIPVAAAARPGLQRALHGAINAGPISTAMRHTGRAVSATGAGVETVAGGIANRPLLRDLTALSAPVVGDAAAAGFVAQAPGYIPRGLTRLAGWTGEKLPQWAEEGAGAVHRMVGASGAQAERRALYNAYKEARQYGVPAQDAFDIGRASADDVGRAGLAFQHRAAGAAEEAAYPLRQFYQDVMTPRAMRQPSMADRIASRMTPGEGMPHGPYQATTADVYGNLAEKGSRLTSRFLNRTEEQAAQAAQRAGQIGERFGRGVENIETAGRALERGATAVGGGLLRGAQGAGMGMKYGGRALRDTGRLLQPMENRAYFRYGTEEAVRPWYEEHNPWRARPERGNIVLAGTQ